MYKDPTEFRQRFAAWKNGELVYEHGLPRYAGGKDDVGNIGKNLGWEIFKILDPTGISSWGDVKRSWSNVYNNVTTKNVANALLETAGAIPMVGKIGKSIKIAANSKKYTTKIAKLVKSLAKEETNINGISTAKNALKSSYRNTKKYLKPKALLDKISSTARTGKFIRNISDSDWRKDVAVNYSENSGGIAEPFAGRRERTIGDDMRYNGSYKSNDKGNPPFSDYSSKQNVVRLAMYGDDSGFKKANISPIISNGDTIGDPNKYYYGTLLPLKKDTMYIPNDYKSLFKKGEILRAELPEDVIDNTFGLYIIDAKKYSYGIKDGFLRAFDPYDQGWENGGPLGLLWDYSTKPNKKYPNSGIPTFILDIPIKYIPGNRYEPKFKDFDRFIKSLLPDENINTGRFIEKYDSINNAYRQ